MLMIWVLQCIEDAPPPKRFAYAIDMRCGACSTHFDAIKTAHTQQTAHSSHTHKAFHMHSADGSGSVILNGFGNTTGKTHTHTQIKPAQTVCGAYNTSLLSRCRLSPNADWTIWDIWLRTEQFVRNATSIYSRRVEIIPSMFIACFIFSYT